MKPYDERLEATAMELWRNIEPNPCPDDKLEEAWRAEVVQIRSHWRTIAIRVLSVLDGIPARDIVLDETPPTERILLSTGEVFDVTGYDGVARRNAALDASRDATTHSTRNDIRSIGSTIVQRGTTYRAKAAGDYRRTKKEEEG